jgi:uncharacterized protein YecT (DUF1311 family)
MGSMKPRDLLLLLMLPSVSVGASFPRARATGALEPLICADAPLSRLDDTLARRYRDALARSPSQDTVRRHQRAWLAGTRNRCGDRTCLTAAYEQRIAALAKTGGAQPGTPPPLTPEALYTSLNLRSFPSAIGPRLKTFCESYPKDFFPRGGATFGQDRLDLAAGDEYWRVRIVGKNRVAISTDITSGTLRESATYTLHYDRQAGDWRAKGPVIPVATDCRPFASP